MKSFMKVFKFIDPLLIYILVVYGLSQVYQRIFEVESVWQTFWERIQKVLGKKCDKKPKKLMNKSKIRQFVN